MTQALSCRWATKRDAAAIFELLRAMHAEVGRARLIDAKALLAISHRAELGLALIVMRGEKIVGTLGLFRSDWWFSDEDAFFSQWFYVDPGERAAGAVMRAIIGEVTDLVESEAVPAFIHVYNGAGKSKTHARRFDEIADEIAVMPSGRILAIEKKG
jgi:hypothetical protein